MEGVCGVIVYRTYQFDEFKKLSSISISITCWMALPTNCVLCVTCQMVPNGFE